MIMDVKLEEGEEQVGIAQRSQSEHVVIQRHHHEEDVENPFRDDATVSSQRTDSQSLPGYEPSPHGTPSSSSSAPLAPSSHASSSSDDWVNTLRELQANLKVLKEAKAQRITESDSSLSSSSFPSFFRKAASVYSVAGMQKLLSPGRKKRHLLFPRKRIPDVEKQDSSAQSSRSTAENLDMQEQEQFIRVHEELVLAGMRRLSNIHPDPIVQAEWAARAAQFSLTLQEADSSSTAEQRRLEEGVEGRERAKDGSLMDIARGLMFLILAPILLALALAEAGMFAAGAMLYGTGKFIVGLGHILTFGRLR